MSEYSPNRWVVLEFVTPVGELIGRKLFGGWYGSYTAGDSWKLNSGITAVRIANDIYEFDGTSGSTYRCHRSGYGMSMSQKDILAIWRRKAAEHGEYEIQEVDLDDIVVY